MVHQWVTVTVWEGHKSFSEEGEIRLGDFGSAGAYYADEVRFGMGWIIGSQKAADLD